MFSCPANNFFWFDMAYHIWHMGLSPWTYVTCTFMFDVDLWPQDQIFRLLSYLLLLALTLAYHIWHIGLSPWEDVSGQISWSWYNFDLWPQGQIYKVYDMALYLWLSFFVLWHSHTLFGKWVYHHGTMCRVHSWTLYDLDLWPRYQNYIFMDLSLARCLWHRYTKFWHMGVSPWDNMLCTFLILLWTWPLTYMWVAWDILSEFYSQFLSCSNSDCNSFVRFQHTVLLDCNSFLRFANYLNEGMRETTRENEL